MFYIYRMLEVTCALIVHHNKILITQNGPQSDHPYQWEFPGGKLEPNETQEACVQREIMEELELQICAEQKLLAVEHDYGIKQIKLIPFLCSIGSGELRLNKHINYKWIELHQLKNIDFSEADKRLLSNSGNLLQLQKYVGKQKDNS